MGHIPREAGVFCAVGMGINTHCYGYSRIDQAKSGQVESAVFSKGCLPLGLVLNGFDDEAPTLVSNRLRSATFAVRRKVEKPYFRWHYLFCGRIYFTQFPRIALAA